MPLVLQQLDVLTADLPQEIDGEVLIELGVGRFDGQVEAAVARAVEGAVLEQWVVQARQFVETEHTQHGAERGQQHHALEGDRDRGGPVVGTLAAHDVLVVDEPEIALGQDDETTTTSWEPLMLSLAFSSSLGPMWIAGVSFFSSWDGIPFAAFFSWCAAYSDFHPALCSSAFALAF